MFLAGRIILLFLFIVDVIHGIWIFRKTFGNGRTVFTNERWVVERDQNLGRIVTNSRNENFEPVFFYVV
jgi:hypothetical protein